LYINTHTETHTDFFFPRVSAWQREDCGENQEIKHHHLSGGFSQGNLSTLESFSSHSVDEYLLKRWLTRC